MALLTGMRSGELMALKWSDIDLDTKLIHVRRQVNKRNGEGPTKGRKKRSVPINSELLTFLKLYRLTRGGEERVQPWLRQRRNGEQAEVTRDFLSSLGLKKAKLHDLRSTFITNLLSQGVSLATVMQIVGHERLNTTDGYLRDAGIEVMGGTDKLSFSVPNDVDGGVIVFPENRVML
ncbi:MAG: site-specific integrase [Bacteriovoracia bacterium]